ncbi:MAG: Rpn family recombination-promoting nuclease/putative transposase [Alkaliphilus sp.]
MTNYLPKNILDIINTNEMQVIKDSFIEKDLQETFSDLLYKVKMKEKTVYVYILFEHKSYPYRLIAFQLLKYITKIWELLIKQNDVGKNGELSLIIPVVFYHGKEKWKISSKLSAIVEETPEDLDVYLPDFKYVLCDLSKYSDEELKGGAILRIFLELTKHVYTYESFLKKLQEIMIIFMELRGKEAGIEYFKVVVKYLLSTRDDLTMRDIVEAVKQTVPERSGDLMTIAQRLRDEGIEKGIEKGKREELFETVTVQLNKRFKTKVLPVALSKKIASLNSEQLRKIRDDIFEIETLEDIKKYLN